MQKALVTGGGGFVGLGIVRALRARGVEVTVVGRHRYPAALALGARCRPGDIRDPAFLTQACAGHDTVFHVAAKAGVWGSWREYYGINVVGTQNVIAACRTNRIPVLVQTSTPSVVYSGELCGVDEETPYPKRFLCHYARSKALAEQEVLTANNGWLRSCALRPHLVWGPGDTNLIPRLLDRGRRGLLTQIGAGDNLVDISYIDNVVLAHLQAADNLHTSGEAAGQAYFISQGAPVNLWGWINELFQRLGIPPVRKQLGLRPAYLLGAALETVYKLAFIRQEPLLTRFLATQLATSHWFSIAKAGRDFAYRPEISTEEGLKRLVAWLQEERPEEKAR